MTPQVPTEFLSMLLVYSTLPRLGVLSDSLTPSTFCRAAAIGNATREISNHFAYRQVIAAVRTRNGPDTSEIHTALIDLHVLVYQTGKDMSEGSYSLLKM